MADMMERAIDILCMQDTPWKARCIGSYAECSPLVLKTRKTE